MKHLKLLIPFVLSGIVLLSFSSCSEYEIIQLSEENIDSILDNPVVFDNQELKESFYDSFDVSYEMAEYYANSLEPDKTISSVEFWGDVNDPLLYLFNYEGGGCVIISSDRRTAPVLAINKSENFSFENNPIESIDLILENLARQIKEIRESNEYPEEFSSCRMWHSIARVLNLESKEEIPKTKDYYEDGEYYYGPYWIKEEVSRVTNRVITDSIPHLIETKWGQDSPWNSSLILGYNSAGIAGHCMVGCANVAIGQILYYLHYKIGSPSGLYHTIVTENNVIVPYNVLLPTTVNRYDYTNNSPRWDQMKKSIGASGNADYVSEFLEDIGGRTSTSYSRSKSSTNVSNVLYGFTNFGINCTVANSYSWGTVNNTINSHLPVFYSANNQQGEGHALIIDGWDAEKDITTYTYHWTLVRDGDPVEIDHDTYFGYFEGHQLNPLEQEYTYEISNSQYTLNYFKCNWGWNGYQDDLSFIANSLEGIEFSQNVKMYYGFNNN